MAARLQRRPERRALAVQRRCSAGSVRLFGIVGRWVVLVDG
jgi:hypothetical protein